MPRVVIDPAMPDGEVLDNEIARLRGLELEELQARWHTAFRRRATSEQIRTPIGCRDRASHWTRRASYLPGRDLQ